MQSAQVVFTCNKIIDVPIHLRLVGTATGTRALSIAWAITRCLKLYHMIVLNQSLGVKQAFRNIVYWKLTLILAASKHYIGCLGALFCLFLIYEINRDMKQRTFENILIWKLNVVIFNLKLSFKSSLPYGRVVEKNYCVIIDFFQYKMSETIPRPHFEYISSVVRQQSQLIKVEHQSSAPILRLQPCSAADEHLTLFDPLPSPNPTLFGIFTFLMLSPTNRSQNSENPIENKQFRAYFVLRDVSIADWILRSYCMAQVIFENFSLLSRKDCYIDEDDDHPRYLQLNSQHKAAIRALRKIRYFIARRKFKEALKPYDVKDVIEQYSSGHADLLTRVKCLHGRLDQILGRQGSKAKDVYESKISLASRIVKVERQVDDIESKLDGLIDLYMEDRKKLLALPPPPLGPSGHPPPAPSAHTSSSYDAPTQLPTSHVPTTSSFATTSAASLSVPGAPPPYSPTSSAPLKPILVDHKQASEPNTPTSKNFERQLTRGYSDVSQRMKKRVTLSSLPSRHSLDTRIESDLLQVPQMVQIDQYNPPYIDDDCD
ncbi:unnamed protein product, partial [Meganyctiphanes norvegica]